MSDFLHSIFGLPTLILTMIPIAILVRIFVRTSRWSILKVTAIAVSGVIISSAWLFYASLITSINLGGEWGRAIGQLIAEKMGDASSFYLLSVCLIAWIIISSLDLIISGARYFINKPYIREIVVEVERGRCRENDRIHRKSFNFIPPDNTWDGLCQVCKSDVAAGGSRNRWTAGW